MSTFTIRARDLITDATSPAIHDAAIVIDDGVVVSVGSWRAVDAAGEIVTVDGVLAPGFVDAHSHLRGLPLDLHGVPARPFESWIYSLGAVSALDPEDEALVATAELLETGVTAVQGFVDVDPGAADVLAGARGALAGVSASGIRGLVVLGFADRALTAPEPPTGDWMRVAGTHAALAPSHVRAIARDWLATVSSPRIGLGIGPIGGQWSTDALLDALADVAGTARVHTHLHESRLHRHWLAGSASPLDRLDASGLLTERISCAHGVHLSPGELDRIAAAGASLVHCPASNDALEVGRAQVAEWLSRGVVAGLGVDSQNTAAPDYFDVMRAALATAARVGAPLTATQVFAMATTGGAHALGVTGGGRSAVNSPADLVELAIEEPSVDALVASGSVAAVRQVWVAGARVVIDGRSVADAAPARLRLRSQLDADSDARAERILAQRPTIDLIDRLTGAAS